MWRATTQRMLALTLTAGAVAGLWTVGAAGARRLVIERIQVPMAGAPELAGLRILHISDTHIAGERTWAVRALRRLEAVQADIIAVTGDVISRAAGLPVAATALGRLRSRLGTFVVPGNHDHWHGRHHDRLTGAIAPFVAPTEFAAAFARCGAAVLANRAVALETDRGRIQVVGLDDPHLLLDRPELAFAGADPGAATLVLAHSPDAALGLRGRRCDLLLCGHTHGGQILGPAGLPPRQTNTRTPIPATYGLMVHEGALTHVSAGIGTAVVPLRFNCPPRATLLEIVEA